MPVLSTRKIFLLHRHLLCHHSCKHINPDTVVIASAVRTPWGSYEGQLTSVAGSQLGSLAVEAAVKQSAVPVEQVKHIFMAENLKQKIDESLDFSKFLRKAQYTSVTTGDDVDFKTVLMGLEALKSKQVEFVVVGALEFATHSPSETRQKLKFSEKDYNFSKSLEKFLKAQKEGLFEEELVPVTVLQQSINGKRRREITQDELLPKKLKDPCETLNFFKGATAFVLTTYATSLKYNITPLAIIKKLEYSNDYSENLSSLRKCLENLLLNSKLKPDRIHHWEMDELLPPPNLNVDLTLINPHGGSLVFGQSTAASLPRMLTHLSHSLKPFQYGCVILNNSKEYFDLIMEKISFPSSPGDLPKLTLYTKDPCPLCDILVEELELNFFGEYELEKVYIDTKENVRFLRLYRYDIPVVFLNGQFLCMHRINNRLLRRKLDLLKEQ